MRTGKLFNSVISKRDRKLLHQIDCKNGHSVQPLRSSFYSAVASYSNQFIIDRFTLSMQIDRNFHHAHVGNRCFRLEKWFVSALRRISLFPGFGFITFHFQSWAQAVFRMACSKLGVATRAFVTVLLSLARAYQLALDVNRDSSRPPCLEVGRNS